MTKRIGPDPKMATDGIRDEDLLAELERVPGNKRFREAYRLAEIQKARDEAVQRQLEFAGLPRVQRRRAEIREVIENEGPSPDNLRFLPTPLAICGLPYRRLGPDKLEYERRQGRMSIVVTAGKLTSPDGERILQPIPWGPKARLIMAHLSTEALRNRSPVIEIAETLTGFMRELGFEATGGKTGTIRLFKEQLRALAACRMEFSAWDGKKSATVDLKPMDRVELWLGDQNENTTKTVQFSTAFYDQLVKHALPIDLRALRAFSNSARKLDLLFWITYRITRMDQKLILDWKPLKEQFGEGIARDRKFKEQLTEDLEAILDLFPKLPVQLTERGLEMQPADASVLSLPKRK